MTVFHGGRDHDMAGSPALNRPVRTREQAALDIARVALADIARHATDGADARARADMALVKLATLAVESRVPPAAPPIDRDRLARMAEATEWLQSPEPRRSRVLVRSAEAIGMAAVGAAAVWLVVWWLTAA